MAQRKRKIDRLQRPGQDPMDRDTRPRGQFERPAGPEFTNRDHPTAPGEYVSAPGAGMMSLETEAETDAPGLPDHKERGGERMVQQGPPPGDGGLLTPPGVTPEFESAGEAAAETNDPNFSAAHMNRAISHRDAGVPRMDTSGRPEPAGPVATHSAHPRLVRDVMTADVEVCNPETELYYVARMMMERDCGSIPVVESTNTMRLVGTITDRDIVVRCIAKNANPLSERARDCMTTELITVSADAPIKECVRKMERAQIRRIPVVDQTGRLCGIVAQADIAESTDERLAAELLKEMSEPMDQAPPT